MDNIIKTTISDGKGNHLLVALDFCDEHYKHVSLQIPERKNADSSV